MNNRQEQIEQARRLIATGISEELVEVLHQQFPELKESEDERIRKEIYDFIFDGIWHQEIIDKVKQTQGYVRWLSWLLEKQKEQKPVEIHIDNPNIQKYDDVKISTSDSSASGDELLYVCNKSYNIGFRDGVASVKPAEHPEKGNEYWFGFNEGKGTVLDNPEQFGLYKPAEWSEEDRKMLDAIIKRYSFPIETDFSVFVGEDNLKDMREELGWLKSLRPRPHWKPSEEQIGALERAIVKTHTVDDIGILAELRDNLKKL